MKSIAIDIGNTRIKVGVFEDDQLLQEKGFNGGVQEWDDLLQEIQPQWAVISNVGADKEWVVDGLTRRSVPLLRVNHQTPFPFSIDYYTPHTLGMDRVAGIAAAICLYPNSPCLVIDAGTCITYDFVSADKVYQGGAIAPGLLMRLKAMHEFTAKLPLPELNWPADFEGKSTVDSLLSGVCVGMADEINGRIARYTQRYGPLQVILCGGDATILAKHIKNNIFAASSLVLMGLNQILLFNVNKG